MPQRGHSFVNTVTGLGDNAPSSRLLMETPEELYQEQPDLNTVQLQYSQKPGHYLQYIKLCNTQQ